MAVDYTNYNSLAIQESEGTQFLLRTGVMDRVATNGGSRSRGLQSGTKYDLQIFYKKLTQAQRDAIVDFYTHNRLSTFHATPSEDGVQRTYSFVGVKPHDIKPGTNGRVFTGSVYFREQ